MGDPNTVFDACVFTFIPGKELTETAVSEVCRNVAHRPAASTTAEGELDLTCITVTAVSTYREIGR